MLPISFIEAIKRTFPVAILMMAAAFFILGPFFSKPGIFFYGDMGYLPFTDYYAKFNYFYAWEPTYFAGTNAANNLLFKIPLFTLYMFAGSQEVLYLSITLLMLLSVFFYMRTEERGIVLSLACAFIYTASAVFIERLGHFNVLFTYALFPLLFFFYRRIFEKNQFTAANILIFSALAWASLSSIPVAVSGFMLIAIHFAMLAIGRRADFANALKAAFAVFLLLSPIILVSVQALIDKTGTISLSGSRFTPATYAHYSSAVAPLSTIYLQNIPSLASSQYSTFLFLSDIVLFAIAAFMLMLRKFENRAFFAVALTGYIFLVNMVSLLPLEIYNMVKSLPVLSGFTVPTYFFPSILFVLVLILAEFFSMLQGRLKLAAIIFLVLLFAISFRVKFDAQDYLEKAIVPPQYRIARALMDSSYDGRVLWLPPSWVYDFKWNKNITSGLQGQLSPKPVLGQVTLEDTSNYAYLAGFYKLLDMGGMNTYMLNDLNIEYVVYAGADLNAKWPSYPILDNTDIFEKVYSDRISVYKVRSEFVTGHFSSTQPLTYKKINPTKYLIFMGGSGRRELVFKESFDSGWVLIPSSQDINGCDGYMRTNSITQCIAPAQFDFSPMQFSALFARPAEHTDGGSYYNKFAVLEGSTFELVYLPQVIFVLGLYVSAATAMALFAAERIRNKHLF